MARKAASRFALALDIGPGLLADSLELRFVIVFILILKVPLEG